MALNEFVGCLEMFVEIKVLKNVFASAPKKGYISDKMKVKNEWTMLLLLIAYAYEQLGVPKIQLLHFKFFRLMNNHEHMVLFSVSKSDEINLV